MMHYSDIVFDIQDLRHLSWQEGPHASYGENSSSQQMLNRCSGQTGSYLKARTEQGGSTRYYKLSSCDSNGVYGHECVNEVIAARLMQVLGVEHLVYRLVHARISIGTQEIETWLNESLSFRREGESKVGLARFFKANALANETPLDLCTRFGWLQSIQKMMLVDFLIGNRDRHGNNIEVLQAADGTIRLAPLFDNGLSFYYSTYKDADLDGLDPLQDICANNFLGSSSLEANLRAYVPANLPIKRLHKQDKEVVLGGLSCLMSERRLDAIWEMIWERWCVYESLCNSGQLAS